MSTSGLFHRGYEAAAFSLAVIFLTAATGAAQNKLPVRWENLTGPDFIQAIGEAQNTCVLPFGIMEKHGPHLPIGTDLFDIRYVAVHAAEQEYAIVFPAYYFGEIFEAREQPGAIAYSARLQMELLQQTADEMARNGCKKIIIANGHGGNPYLIRFFIQTQMAKRRNYVVYYFPFTALLSGPHPPMITDKINGHAGQSETSTMLVSRPDLVHMDRCNEESGARQGRLSFLPPTLFSAMGWWYANFPNHYAGDGCLGTKAVGQYIMKDWIHGLVEAIRAVKADNESLKIQNAFYNHAAHPLQTPQTGTWWIK